MLYHTWINGRDYDVCFVHHVSLIGATVIQVTCARSRVEASEVKRESIMSCVAHSQMRWNDGKANESSLVVVARPVDGDLFASLER